MIVCEALRPLSAKILRSAKPFAFYYFLPHIGMKHWPKKGLTDFSLIFPFNNP